MTHTLQAIVLFHLSIFKGCYKDLSFGNLSIPTVRPKMEPLNPQAPSGGNSRCSIRYHVINDLKSKSAPICSM